MTLDNIAKACGGQLLGKHIHNNEISGVAIDSRKIEPGFLFVAIQGERVDGHSFIDQVYEKGALCCLVEKSPKNAENPYILVKSTLQALKEIAMFYKQTLSVKVIGITGSVGKTSTKEVIATVLSQRFNVLKTEGNYNNEIGLPLTIFKIKKEHEIAVLEMGISDFGEMHRLSQIARPDICVITNIGYSHLENLKDREGILKAKSEMFDYMQPDGKICLNGDDDMLSTISDVDGKKPLFFGLQKQNTVYADSLLNQGLEGTLCNFHVEGEEYQVFIPMAGEHMVYNALAAAGVAHILGLHHEEIVAGISEIQSVKGRNNILKTEKYTIIDDCYNANPISMKASIEILSHGEGRKVAILGDMLELGEESDQYHKEIGEFAIESKINCILCVGESAKHIFEAAMENSLDNKIMYFADKESLVGELHNIIKTDDTILVKASHGMAFETIVAELLRK